VSLVRPSYGECEVGRVVGGRCFVEWIVRNLRARFVGGGHDGFWRVHFSVCYVRDAPVQRRHPHISDYSLRAWISFSGHLDINEQLLG
jgi:hypothetical protein